MTGKAKRGGRGFYVNLHFRSLSHPNSEKFKNAFLRIPVIQNL